MDTFALALKFTLGAEKGFVIDDGGPTNYGVTQVTYDAYRTRHGLTLQSVRMIAMYEVHDIYISMYWMASGANYLPTKSAICHFDWAVNHGVFGATEDVQHLLHIAVDGNIGPITIAAMRAAQDDVLVPAYLAFRRNWYRTDAGNNLAVAPDLNGWLNRVDALQAYTSSIGA